MNLVRDYFLLYHSIHFEDNQKVLPLKFSDDREIFYIFSVILTVRKKELDKVLSLSSFSTLFKQLNLPLPKKLENLYTLQQRVLMYIQQHAGQEDMDRVCDSFLYFKNESFLDDASHQRLVSLFKNQKSEIKPLKRDKKSNVFLFKQRKEDIVLVLNTLAKQIENKEILEDVSQVHEYLNNQTFSVGITGVMNAGKSTMLNALMGKEVLGTSVVPETANLTIIKYGKTDKSRVCYWNTKEWNRIVTASTHLESMKNFVEETTSVFKNELSSYIQETSRVDEVDASDLSAYTSAKKSNKKCNLIKYVELETNLHFLEDGVEIVDTPGLDDPVIQREEITKEYIGRCDIMLHLMNVSQSATKKDVEFIIDALLYQNVAKLLVVITRADTVSSKQLDEVIHYTKHSIENRLSLQNKEGKLNDVLNAIEFIAISGKEALEHRIQFPNTQNKEILEQTGILKIEHYLNQNLFGKESKKSEVILQSAKKQLLRVIEKQKDDLVYKMTLSTKSKEELEDELANFYKKNARQKKNLNRMNGDLNYYKEESQIYLTTLANFLDSALFSLKTKIRERVVSDVRYSFEKTKKRPESSRIKVIVEIALKDGVIDILRDYRYKFVKKCTGITEQCEHKYRKFNFDFSEDFSHDNMHVLFKDDFKSGFLIANHEVMITQIIESTARAKAKKITLFDQEINHLIERHFVDTEVYIKNKVDTLSDTLLHSFFKLLYAPIVNIEDKFSRDEKTLKSLLDSFSNQEKSTQDTSLMIHEKIKELDSMKHKLSGDLDE